MAPGELDDFLRGLPDDLVREIEERGINSAKGDIAALLSGRVQIPKVTAESVENAVRGQIQGVSEARSVGPSQGLPGPSLALA